MNIERNDPRQAAGTSAGSRSAGPSQAADRGSDPPLIEQLLVEKLIDGEAQFADPQEEAVKRLPPRWEIRIQSERDPVAEETAKYRSIAKEVDDRYDRRDKQRSKGGHPG